MNQPKSNQQSEYSTNHNVNVGDHLRQQMGAVGHQSPPKVKTKNKQRLWVGLSGLIVFIVVLYMSGSSTATLKDVQANGIGKGMAAGTTLTTTDETADLEPRDYEIAMKKDTTTSRMLIWDFAAEDGDFVTVKVDGVVLATNIGILHKPMAFNIPVPSKVEIIGVKDGGGGITYGVKFPGAAQNSVYFNATPVGSANVYTVTGQ
nr:hypothetical protein [Paenibacillus sp. GSMTC-2017]